MVILLLWSIIAVQIMFVDQMQSSSLSCANKKMTIFLSRLFENEFVSNRFSRFRKIGWQNHVEKYLGKSFSCSRTLRTIIVLNAFYEIVINAVTTIIVKSFLDVIIYRRSCDCSFSAGLSIPAGMRFNSFYDCVCVCARWLLNVYWHIDLVVNFWHVFNGLFENIGT